LSFIALCADQLPEAQQGGASFVPFGTPIASTSTALSTTTTFARARLCLEQLEREATGQPPLSGLDEAMRLLDLSATGAVLQARGELTAAMERTERTLRQRLAQAQTVAALRAMVEQAAAWAALERARVGLPGVLRRLLPMALFARHRQRRPQRAVARPWRLSARKKRGKRRRSRTDDPDLAGQPAQQAAAGASC
jgi:hypothetical protein